MRCDPRCSPQKWKVDAASSEGVCRTAPDACEWQQNPLVYLLPDSWSPGAHSLAVVKFSSYDMKINSFDGMSARVFRFSTSEKMVCVVPVLLWRLIASRRFSRFDDELTFSHPD
jgi:hypothetical protein